MKKKLVARVMLLVSATFLFASCGYNGMVEKQETVEQAWGNVEVQFQRRANLIDNLVETVKGYANFEHETLVDVIEARSKATSVTVKADQLSEENVQKYQEAQGQLTSAIGRLLFVSEQYPELKANEGFRDLRVELAGTENRIAQATRQFNDAVKEYNSFIRKFPQNITAGWFGFETKGYFKADPGAEKAPKVKF